MHCIPDSLSRTLWAASFSGLLLYTVAGPLRGQAGVLGRLPLLGLAVGTLSSGLSLLISRRLSISRTTGLVGLLLITLIVCHPILNFFYPYSTWSGLDIVNMFYPAVVVFWIPVIVIAAGGDSEGNVAALFGGHALTTVGVSVGILFIGFQIVESPVHVPLGDRLGIFERNTYPLNTHTIYVTYVVPATVYAFGNALRGEHQRLWGTGFCVLVATALLTQIRKVYLAILVGIILYALFDDRYRETTAKSLVLGSPILSGSLYLIHRLAPGSTLARVEQFSTAIPFAARHPLGAGHESVEVLLGATGPHNIFLDALTEYGLVAFVLLVVVCGLIVLRACRWGTNSSDVITMSLAASVVAVLVGLQFESPYHLQRFWLFVGIFYGHVDAMAVSRPTDDGTQAEESEQPSGGQPIG